LQLDFRLFLQPFLVGFLRIASLYFIFLIFILKKSEFWGITQNWVMTTRKSSKKSSKIEKKKQRKKNNH
jgi:hypothetical protein